MTPEEEWYRQQEAHIARGREEREGILEEIRKAQAIVVPNEEPKFVRPPLGLTPRYLVDEIRLEAIEKAIERYNVAGYEVPQDWLDERKEILDRWGQLLPEVYPYVKDLRELFFRGAHFEQPVAVITYESTGLVHENVHVTRRQLFELEEAEGMGKIRVTKFEGLPAVK